MLRGGEVLSAMTLEQMTCPYYSSQEVDGKCSELGAYATFTFEFQPQMAGSRFFRICKNHLENYKGTEEKFIIARVDQ